MLPKILALDQTSEYTPDDTWPKWLRRQGFKQCLLGNLPNCASSSVACFPLVFLLAGAGVPMDGLLRAGEDAVPSALLTEVW